MSHEKVLILKVINGRNLYDPNWISTLDPYVIAKVGQNEKKTTSVSKSKNPVWNQELSFPWNSSHTDLHLKVWDDDVGSIVSLGRDLDLQFVSVRTPTVLVAIEIHIQLD